MKTPPFSLGAAAIFWGWQTGLHIPALICAIVMEAHWLFAARLHFGHREYRWIWNLSMVIFLVTILVSMSGDAGFLVFFTLAKWLPIIFLPMAASQVYGAQERIELASISWFFRNSRSRGPGDEAAAINLTYPYLVMLIASASVGNTRGVGFYIAFGLLAGWALWAVRPKSFPVYQWAACFIFIFTAGYGLSVGLHRLQGIVEDRLIDLYSEWFLSQPDPFTTSSSIGEIGRLKTSNRIILRVKADAGYTDSIYLPFSSYNLYKTGSWHAMRAPLQPVAPEKNGLTWNLIHGASPQGPSLEISMYIRGDDELLPAPENALRLERLAAHKMFTHRLGAIKVGGTPGFFRFVTKSAADGQRISPPDEIDLKIPPGEERWLVRAVEELGLVGKTPRQAMEIIDGNFQRNFSYSLDLKVAPGVTPLEGFFFHTRSGHCEYFASASVLLLRAAGIPARYFNGYMANEYSSLEKAYIVRSRDAHAWPMAFVDGRWILFDTTPASWMTEDKESGGAFEPLYDFASFLYMLFSDWRWKEGSGISPNLLAPLLLPLGVFLAWRIFSNTRISRARKREQASLKPATPKPGASSAFYIIERRLNEMGYFRSQWETQAEFVRRVIAQRPDFSGPFTLSLLDLHYRLRFDPKGLTQEENSAMLDAVALWVEEARQATTSLGEK